PSASTASHSAPSRPTCTLSSLRSRCPSSLRVAVVISSKAGSLRRRGLVGLQALKLLLVGRQEGLAEECLEVVLGFVANGLVVLQVQIPQPGLAVHRQHAV